MELNTNDSDSSISLDTTWFVLDENEVITKDRGDSPTVPEKNIENKSSKIDISIEQDNKFINEEIPEIETVDVTDNENITEDIELENIENNQEEQEKITGQLVPLSEEEITDIKNITDGRRFRNLNERNLVACDFDVSYVAELLLLLAKISIGSFFISFCILSLIFLTHSSWEYLDANATNCQEVIPNHYTILNNNNTWYNTYYPIIDEEEMIQKHCNNKFKQGAFKGKAKSCKKFSERRMKHFMRPYIFDKLHKKKNTTSTNQPKVSGPLNENEYYEKVVDTLEEKYNNLKEEYYDQQQKYKALKNQSELKNNMNKQCIKLMLKEIVELNRELKSKNEQNIKTEPKKLDKISVAHLDSNLWYLMNSDINDKIKYERLGRVRLHNALNDPFIKNLNITKTEQEKSIELMEKKIKEMTTENTDIANAIKIKQKELFTLTHDITSSIRFLEYKRVVLHFFENRLKVLKEMPTIDKTKTNNNETSLMPLNIPFNHMDERNEKTMAETVLDDIINSTISKQQTKSNICLCEIEEDGFSQESLNETMQLEKKRIELDNLISSRLSKLQTESNEPFRKLAYIAQWDDKTIWFSRKLNDKEHARLLHMYPKCNPAKGWIRNRRFTH